jgi:uncharacterized Tic20 family protein
MDKEMSPGVKGGVFMEYKWHKHSNGLIGWSIAILVISIVTFLILLVSGEAIVAGFITLIGGIIQFAVGTAINEMGQMLTDMRNMMYSDWMEKHGNQQANPTQGKRK